MTTFSENERGQASAKVWLAKAYVQDLIEFANGDENRFGRMVDSRGVSVASPAMWLNHLAIIAANPAVQHFYPDTMSVLIEKLNQAGFKLPELKEVKQ